MGGCYSTSSQSATLSPEHKRPRFRSIRRSKKKRYSPVHTSDSQSQSQHDPEVSSNGKSVSYEQGIEGKRNSCLKQAVLDEEKGVVPSDSGVESLEKLVTSSDPVELAVDSSREITEDSLGKKEFILCRACHLHLQKINRGLCGQCGQFQIDASALFDVGNENETYCTCGPRQLGKASVCRTHAGRGSAASPHSRLSGKENGYTVSADSSGKEHFGSCENKVSPHASPLLSSADKCLSNGGQGEMECDGAFLATKINDYCEVLNFVCKCEHISEPVGRPELQEHALTPLDRGQTHVSGSLLELLSSSPARQTPNRLPDSGDHLPVQQEEKVDDDSGHGTAKFGNHTESMSDMEELDLGTGGEFSDFSEQSSPLRTAAERALETVSDNQEEVVCQVTVGDREMVVIDLDTYTCMLNDLAVLKEQLHDLTQVFLEDGTLPVESLDLSVQ